MARSINVPLVAEIRKVRDRETLRGLAADPALDRRFEDIGPLANRGAVERVNEALRLDGKPLPVFRQAIARASTAVGKVASGTLVMLQFGKISEKTRDPETVVMAGTWAEYRVMNFVPALYRAVWEGALATETAERR